MSHTKHPHAQTESEDSGGNRPYWKRAHHDWKFWIALVLMLTAMGVYITTLDLSLAPNVPGTAPQSQPVP